MLNRVPALLSARLHERRHLREFGHAREELFARLRDFGTAPDSCLNDAMVESGSVFVDGFFANPLFWFRYSLVRRALGLSGRKEKLLLGDYQAGVQAAAANALGISEMVRLTEGRRTDEVRVWTKRIQAAYFDGVRPMEIEMPFNVPGQILYDYILNSQTSAEIDPSHHSFLYDVKRFVAFCFAADEAFEKHKPGLVIASHPDSVIISFVWQALIRGIKVIVADSDFNTLRLWDINASGSIFDYGDRAKLGDICDLPKERLDKLEVVGRRYLEKRISGQTDDLGATFAYVKRPINCSREEICRTYGWDSAKPLIGIYASNWFDYPHTYGMKNFVNFKDWICDLVDVAADREDVNWLFKAHPCDAWYGGVTMEEVLAGKNRPNLGICSEAWAGVDLIEALDGIITYHGTIGIEATILETPVLVADRGWYDDWEFVIRSDSREAFLDRLRTNWWEGVDVAANARMAAIFGGIFWGRPSWQKDFLMPDDTRGIETYRDLIEITKSSSDLMEAEVRSIRNWADSAWPHYHAYKMLSSTDYVA